MEKLENKIREVLPRLQEVDHFFGVRINKEHPIKLNDVLQYLVYLGFPIGSYQYKQVLKLWYLDSVFLADQSDELKEFLNNL